MIPRPLYRWKSFWLGLFVLGFLAWAWRDSLDRVTGLGFQTPAGSGGLLQHSGEVCIFRTHVKRGWGWTIFNVPKVENSPVSRSTWERISALGIVLPHWSLMLAFSGGGGAFLLWRWRRLKQRSER